MISFAEITLWLLLFTLGVTALTLIGALIAALATRNGRKRH